MKNLFKLALIIIGGFLLIQLIPYGRNHNNPPVTIEPKWDSPQTRELAKRACFDCHSNETTWPWYSNVAPVSWLVLKDVEEGRSVFNLSEWTTIPEVRSESGRLGSIGQALGEAVTSGEMPPMQYLVLHPEADLSRAERGQLAQGFQTTLGHVTSLAQR